MARRTSSVHCTQFFPCVDEPGTHRAACSCGWAACGDLEDVQARAAAHPLNDERERERIREAVLRPGGFVSGLPGRGT